MSQDCIVAHVIQETEIQFFKELWFVSFMQSLAVSGDKNTITLNGIPYISQDKINQFAPFYNICHHSIINVCSGTREHNNVA